jgi:hypothetical protein
MYVSTYLLTVDNFYIFSQKSQVSIQRNTINLLGGALNQDELELHTTSDIFETLYKELSEEIALSRTTIKSSEGIGLFLTDTMRIAAILETQLTISKEELQKTHTLNFENSSLLFVPELELQTFLKNSSAGINPNIQETAMFLLH